MIESIYQSALLADAAYVDFGEFTGVITDARFDSALRTARQWTDAQILQFKDDYEIFKQYDFLSGLSVTVFQDRHSGEMTVAFRGTEGSHPFEDPRDLIQDLFLTLGYSQNPATGALGQLGGIALFLHDIGAIDNLGNSNLNAQYHITGHSLGGHLAIMMGMLWPNLVASIDTFNGAGVSPLDWVLLRANPFVTPLNENLVNNYYGEAGLELASNDWFYNRPGDKSKIWIEDASATGDPLDTHYIYHIVQSLSLYRIFSLLDPTLDSEAGLSKLFNIFEGMASDAGTNVIETIYHQLELLTDKESDDDAQKLYANIATANLAMPILDLTSLSADDLAGYAKSNTKQKRGQNYFSIEN